MWYKSRLLFDVNVMPNLSINRKLQCYTVLKAQFLTIPSRQKL